MIVLNCYGCVKHGNIAVKLLNSLKSLLNCDRLKIRLLSHLQDSIYLMTDMPIASSFKSNKNHFTVGPQTTLKELTSSSC